MTLEVKFDPGFGIYNLDYICFHVSLDCKSHNSQNVPTRPLLFLPLKPCQDEPLTSRARSCW